VRTAPVTTPLFRAGLPDLAGFFGRFAAGRDDWDDFC